MQNIECSLFYRLQMMLGEGPVWEKDSGSLLWTDILGKKLYSLCIKSGKLTTFDSELEVCCYAVDHGGNVIAALRDGVYRLNTGTGEWSLLCKPESDRTFNRFNDGKTDPTGRFWFGSMAGRGSSGKPTGALYRMEADLSYKRILDGVGISNGLAWSPDDKTMYFIDTSKQYVMAYDYDRTTGDIANARIAAEISADEGSPDGMTIDSEGMLWVAHWGGSGVSRFNPNTGEKLAFIKIPATFVTSCIFGGENLDELYITTAARDPGTLAREPLAGSVFVAKPGVKGLPCTKFNG